MTPHQPRTWTDERKKLATQWWREGMSASQIATRLGGTTRNAVISMLHRSGAVARAVGYNQTARKRAGAMTRAKQKLRAKKLQSVSPEKAFQLAAEPLPEERPATGATIAPADRDDSHCQWIYGEVGKGHRYCGCAKVAGTSWCAEHVKIVFPNYGQEAKKKFLSRVERVAKLEDA